MDRIDACIVADAGPVIHLDELGCLDLLADFPRILIPQEVWSEIIRHRSDLIESAVPNAAVIKAEGAPSPQLTALADSLGLDAGERAALLLLEVQGANLLLCDDAAARLAAEALGFTVHGTIGVLVRSIRFNRRAPDEVSSLLASIPQRSTLHISRKLLMEVIASVSQAEPQ